MQWNRSIFRVKLCLFWNFLFANVGSEPRVHLIVSYSKCRRERGSMGKGKKEGERENMTLHDKFIWGEQGVEEVLSFPPSLTPFFFSCSHLSLSLNKINMYTQIFVPLWWVSRFYLKKQQITCPLSLCWRVIKHKKRTLPKKNPCSVAKSSNISTSCVVLT